MTIRGDAEVIIDEHSGLSESGYPRCVICELDGPCRVVRRARSIIDQLDNSREVTEKVTTYDPDHQWKGYGLGPGPKGAYVVSHHKARIVYDD